MEPAVEFREISKYFPSSRVQADKDVSFSVSPGEIHAVCGENGAGKSTLMNMLYGLYEPDSGEILLDGTGVSISTPQQAISYGVGMVHQHFKLVPSFSVAENIFLGMEKGHGGFLNKNQELKKVKEISQFYKLGIDPSAIVASLPVGLQQRVEILKLLVRDVSILILDEPTAVLTPAETRDLLVVIKKLAASGKTIFFISHKLGEVLEVADRITVMRKGCVTGTRKREESSIEELARMMVGRDVVLRQNRRKKMEGQTVLDISDLVVLGPSGNKVVNNLSFSVQSGEIYGIAGVSGNGQEALAGSIVGLMRNKSGRILLNGKDLSKMNTGERRKLGLSYVPEDRINVGLNIQSNIKDNVIIGRHKTSQMQRHHLLDDQKTSRFTQQLINEYSVAGASVNGAVAGLSGGNMQKVVLAREISSDPKLLIVNQPTRGLDVGSIEFVHESLLQKREEGVAILLLSVELDEIMSLSDRIGVLYRGKIVGEMNGSDAVEEKLGLLMAGGKIMKQGEV